MQPALSPAESNRFRPCQEHPRAAQSATGRKWLAFVTLGATLLVAAAGAFWPASAAELAANVDDNRILQADRDSANWLTYGRTYSEHTVKPL